MNFRLETFFLIMIVVFTSCTNRQSKEQILSAEIEKRVLDEGNKISQTAQNQLQKQLKSAIIKGGPSHAVATCNLMGRPMMDSVLMDRKIDIKRASIRTRNLGNAATSEERKILEDYEKQLQAKEEIAPRVEVLNEKQLLYTKPIFLNNPLCLNCHGEIGLQIQEETYKILKQLYPKDNAANHKLGDLRGIWSITFHREELANMLSK